MGVLGLWRLIEGVGKPVAFETLEDQVIVIGKKKISYKNCEIAE